MMSSLDVGTREVQDLLEISMSGMLGMERELVGELDLDVLAGLFPGLEGFAVLSFLV